jgi:hypothetical protein
MLMMLMMLNADDATYPGEYEDESEYETEDEETEKKEVPVKTLVSEIPPDKKGDEITKAEPSSSGVKVSCQTFLVF